MSRAVIVIRGANDTLLAKRWIDIAPTGTRVEFKAPKRTTEQNDRMWAMLTDIASQKEHHGRKYSTEVWKRLFLHALWQEIKFIPSLDNSTLIPIGQSSSDLSVEEMSSLIDLMHKWGAENGVKFHDEQAGIREQDKEGGI